MKAILSVGILAALILSPLIGNSQDSDRAIRRAPGEKRVALVVGNAAYKNASPLKNAVNDAEDMASVLQRKGFDVTLRKDVTHAEMEKSIREFGKSIHEGGVGLFFYAGHGIQVSGTNYLIPVDSDIQEEDEVKFKAVDANLVLSKMQSAQNSLNIVVLDACRVNPFATRFRSGSQGLAQMDAPSGSLVVFATSPGRVAEDGKGKNGTFTKHLLAKMDVPGLEVSEMLRQVRVEVENDTGRRQTPWELSSLRGKFYFTISIGPAGEEDAISSPTVVQGPDERAWKLIENSKNIDDFKDFLGSFPESKLASLASFKIKVITRQKESDRDNAAAGRIESLLAKAQAAYDRNELLTPAETSAIRYYKEVFSIDERERAAYEGTVKATQKYLDQARAAIAGGKTGASHISKAQECLGAIPQTLKNQNQTQIASIQDEIKALTNQEAKNQEARRRAEAEQRQRARSQEQDRATASTQPKPAEQPRSVAETPKPKPRLDTSGL